MPKKLQPINYTSRDYDSIRRDLEDYAKRYYSNTYKDFSEASFGSLMLDTVAYIGDILSFYLDYQTNESFLETAIEYENVVRLARQMGFRLNTSPSSYGILTFYVQIPALTSGPDLSYAPVLKAGSIFNSTGGGTYTLLEDVDFARSENQIVAGQINSATDSPNTFVIRAMGTAVSGRSVYKEVQVGAFQRFLRVPLETNNVAEVISIVDSEGHTYYEVDNLSQNIIYKAIRNTNTSTNGTVGNILKATPVARRFTVERNNAEETYVQFGYGSNSEHLSNSVFDPTNVVLDLNGRTYVTDRDFDPTKLISTDKFGIAPSDTTLSITYRVNTVQDANSATDTITSVERPIFRFTDQGALSRTLRNVSINSLEVTNEEPFVGDISLPSSEEIKQRVFGFYATQHRAVTVQDYQAIAYGMPTKFGAIKRVAVIRDFDELKRNINLYVLSEDVSGKFTTANQTLKNNLKSWILQYKMINDTVDILDAVVANFGINYKVVLDLEANRYTTVNKANAAIAKHLRKNIYDIGEEILITDFYKILQKVEGIVDVVDLEIVGKGGASYSDFYYDFEGALSANGRRITAEKNIVFELKFPNIDIKGAVQ